MGGGSWLQRRLGEPAREPACVQTHGAACALTAREENRGDRDDPANLNQRGAPAAERGAPGGAPECLRAPATGLDGPSAACRSLAQRVRAACGG